MNQSLKYNRLHIYFTNFSIIISIKNKIKLTYDEICKLANTSNMYTIPLKYQSNILFRNKVHAHATSSLKWKFDIQNQNKIVSMIWEISFDIE